jgi:Uma2 family endonuclease
MSTVSAEPEYRLLRGQTWQDYQRALAEREQLGRRYRITYDRGVLEIMTVGAPHEQWKMRLANLLELFMMERAIPFDSLGNWTVQREDLDRGLEPDLCYYIQNEALVRGRSDLDLEHVPPPDLAIEVEVSRTVHDRIGIYEALGVPEIWRYGGEAVTVLVRGPNGGYGQSATSRAIPSFPLDEVRRRMQAVGMTDQGSWMRDWQAWVRANVTG